VNGLFRKITKPPACLYITGVVILLVGLGGSLVIYWSAGDDVYGVLGYETANGYVYPVMPEDSKLYLRNLELYGGRMGVLLDSFRRWLAGRWHGKNLAFTVAFITLCLSFGFIYIAHQWPTHADNDIHHKDGHNGTG